MLTKYSHICELPHNFSAFVESEVI